MPTSQFLFTNVLQIPNLFGPAFEAMMHLGFLVFSLMLIVAILHENLDAIRGQSDYIGLFVRAMLVLSLLVVYERFFTWIVYSTDLLSKSILPQDEFKKVVETAFKEIMDKKDLGKQVLFYITKSMNYITYMLALAVLGILTWLRFIFLSLLFVIGPLLVAIGVYKETSQGLNFWIKSLVAVSLWNVVLSILMKVVSAMNITSVYLPSETNTVSVLAANLLFIILFISVPIISQQITSGGSLSGLGTAAAGIITAFITRLIIKPPRPKKLFDRFRRRPGVNSPDQEDEERAGTPGFK